MSGGGVEDIIKDGALPATRSPASPGPAAPPRGPPSCPSPPPPSCSECPPSPPRRPVLSLVTPGRLERNPTLRPFARPPPPMNEWGQTCVGLAIRRWPLGSPAPPPPWVAWNKAGAQFSMLRQVRRDRFGSAKQECCAHRERQIWVLFSGLLSAQILWGVNGAAPPPDPRSEFCHI